MKAPRNLLYRCLLRRATTRYAGRLVLSACAVLGSVLAGCSAPRTKQTALPPTQRFIEEAPQDIFSLEEVSTTEQSFVWTFQSSADATPWSSPNAGAELYVENQALVLRPASPPRMLVEREAAIDAAEVDLVEVEFKGLRPTGPVRLFWTREGEEFSNARSMRLAFRQGNGREWKVFNFAVSSHLEWSGQITRMRLQVAAEPGQTLHLRRLTGLHRALSVDRFATAVSRPWKVMLQQDLRSALLALPGVAIERTMVVPPASRLEIAYGAPETMQTPVHFLVLATGEEAGAPAEVIFEHRIDPREEGFSSWQEASVSLDAYAGERVHLSLQVEVPVQPDPLRGLPVWGNPRVVSTSGEQRPPNIVLISIDTLRADHLSLYGYPRPTSPNIDRWAEESAMVFRTAVAAAPWTLPSHVSLLTGITPLRHGVNHPTPTPTSLDTLAEVLRRAGYTTAAVTGGSYLHPEFGLAQGFDHYRSVQGNLDLELVKQMDMALQWLRSASEDKPFFFFFHTYEVHDPYLPREPYLSSLVTPSSELLSSQIVVRSLNPRSEDGYQIHNEFRLRDAAGSGPETPISRRDLPSVVDLYDSGIAYTDHHLGRLFETLKELGLNRETIVVVTSDHGEALGEHGLAGHGSLYDHDLLVPLIIALPNNHGTPRHIRQQVSSIDLFPTLLDLADLPLPTGIDGHSLVPLFTSDGNSSPRVATSYATLSNRGLSLRIQDRFKYILHNTPWRPPTGIEELYDLTTDAREEENIAATSPRLRSLRQRAKSALDQATGLRIRFVNTTGSGYRGSINSPLLQPATVKTPDLFSCCSFGRRNQVRFDLPPGGSFTLFLENASRRELRFSGELIPDASEARVFNVQFEENQLDQPQTLVFDGSGWSLADNSSGTVPSNSVRHNVTLTFWWTGESHSFGTSPAESDEELREQLKALGYIN